MQIPKKDQKLYDNYEDALFRLLMHNAAGKEGQLTNEKINHPDNHEAKYMKTNVTEKQTLEFINATLKKNQSKKLENHAHIKLKRAVAIIAAVAIVFSIGMLTVSAFRIQVFNVVLGIKDKYTSFQLKENGEDQNSSQMIVDWKNAYVPTYIPDGYEVSDLFKTDDLKSLTYKNKQDNSLDIVYSEFATSSVMQLDTENAALVQTLTINGNTGTLIIKDNMASVAWIMDNKMFSVIGQVDSELLIKIAESVKYVK